MKRALLAIAVAAFLTGCGGSGGAGSVGSSALSLFVTDSMDGNDHVWVTIKSVDLIGSGGASTNVFSDSAGKTVDLKTLRDATGARFEFLNQGNVPAGTYSGAKVTLDKNLVVFPHLAATGTAMTFDAQYDDGAGNSAINFEFESPKTVQPGSDHLVVDFDLANWTEVDGIVTVSLKEGDDTGLDSGDRHEVIHYPGTISGLQGDAPNFTFTLAHGDHMGFPVSTNADTNIFQSDGGTPVLADGKDVVVEGTWDQVTGKLVAKSVRVLTAEDEQTEEASADGPVTEFSADQGFVRIDTDEAEGFVPMANSVRLEFNDATVFLSGDATITKDQFFALLATGVKVEAEGAYDPGTFVLTASHVRVDSESESPG